MKEKPEERRENVRKPKHLTEGDIRREKINEMTSISSEEEKSEDQYILKISKAEEEKASILEVIIQWLKYLKADCQ